MQLQKFGVKLFLNTNKNYESKDFIPVFHSWIQNKAVEDHLLIDVADYSHIQDGPGVMLVAHEGNFSLDQESLQPGIMYMRKTKIKGDFIQRFNNVLTTTIETANRLCKNNIIKDVHFKNNSFRFIANDRLFAEHTTENQDLYKKKIQKAIDGRYPGSQFEFEDFSDEKERLAFTVTFTSDINITNQEKERLEEKR